MEELRLSVSDLHVYKTVPYGDICFTFITGQAESEPARTEHEEIRFVQARTLLDLPFCPADAGIARRLALSEPRLQAFFWDFDGTLFDTYPMMTRALREACRSFGVRGNQDDLPILMK